jgi:hypothetical protein
VDGLAQPHVKAAVLVTDGFQPVNRHVVRHAPFGPASPSEHGITESRNVSAKGSGLPDTESMDRAHFPTVHYPRIVSIQHSNPPNSSGHQDPPGRAHGHIQAALQLTNLAHTPNTCRRSHHLPGTNNPIHKPHAHPLIRAGLAVEYGETTVIDTSTMAHIPLKAWNDHAPITSVASPREDHTSCQPRLCVFGG